MVQTTYGRLADILEIQNKTQVPFYYIVKEVDNQTDRNFIAWRAISFTEFQKCCDVKNIKEGGAGMGSLSDSYPTVMVAFEKFKTMA